MTSACSARSPHPPAPPRIRCRTCRRRPPATRPRPGPRRSTQQGSSRRAGGAHVCSGVRECFPSGACAGTDVGAPRGEEIPDRLATALTKKEATVLARFSLTPIAPLDDHEPSGNRAPSAECDSGRPAAVDTEAVGVSCQLVTVGVGPSKRPTALSETAAFVGGAATSIASKISSAADEDRASRRERLDCRSLLGMHKLGSGGLSPGERRERRVVTGDVREFADEHGYPQSTHSVAGRSRLYGTGRQGYESSALPPRIRHCDHGSWARETEPQPEARRHDRPPGGGRGVRPRHRAS